MKKAAVLKMLASMTVFGTIGLAVRHVAMPRGLIATLRGFVGAAVILLFLLIVRARPSLAAIKRNLLPLIFSGGCIGVNWILLFESYSYTTVAVSTLCYYMAPVFVILLSPFLFGERITAKKGVCILFALVGMLFVSGVLDGGALSADTLVGVGLALGAALFYAALTLISKRLVGISSYDTSIVQLFFASLVILPYTLFFEDYSGIELKLDTVAIVLLICILHTGVAYTLYFSSVKSLPAQSSAIMSYVDPVVALLCSVLLLDEPMTVLTVVGAVLILSSTLVCELDTSRISEKLLRRKSGAGGEDDGK